MTIRDTIQEYLRPKPPKLYDVAIVKKDGETIIQGIFTEQELTRLQSAWKRGTEKHSLFIDHGTRQSITLSDVETIIATPREAT